MRRKFIDPKTTNNYIYKNLLQYFILYYSLKHLVSYSPTQIVFAHIHTSRSSFLDAEPLIRTRLVTE